MNLIDSRRITGPSLFTEKSGAMLEVDVSENKVDQMISDWELSIQQFLSALGWENEITQFRIYDGGASLFMSAPIDALYAACEVNESAFNFSRPENKLLFDDQVSQLGELINEELDPMILGLRDAAINHGIKFLQSDEIISVGSGTGVKSFNVDAIPHPNQINWDSVHDIPSVLVTGTNGKSTTVRLMEAILSEAEIKAGASSTDGIRVNRETIEKGDYSGPEGARSTMRNKAVETAVLEVARGGILRRGLPVYDVDAALITNIAEDHFGDYGVNSIAEMAQTKFIVSKGLAKNGTLVLNGDDDAIIAFSKTISKNICWFSLTSENPQIQNHINSGGQAAFLDGEEIFYSENGTSTPIMNVKDIPITMNGTARYNIANCLGTICLAKALNINNDAILSGLKKFTNSFENNPGRGNYFEKKGVSILMDFAHNPHGVSALIDVAKRFKAKRKLILMSQAGDRSNLDIQNFVNEAMTLNPDRVHIAEMSETYLRGRELGEVPDVFKNAFLSHGLEDKSIKLFPDNLTGVKAALDWAKDGDFLLLLVLDTMVECNQLIQQFD
ncbi:MAG: Mur ligase [Candidatus Marinimicrobia bacterium]|mgnify:CR=1 FL=1|jgi:UDP-N-acetylmuramyl tripeptide synthase|nr:Mur ligase [Candidatus Neomarinimicrobiota bacterium]MBT3675479.1 Mur ligase [Candidatus Neomarinimicrobiota bacterium]MBT3762809.1 Mur ligase [Candidatus Neomarinimicrobiota bacterium]MBT4069289.1 Mur ligase [Candidatus Neomarinimicrobiota bacterium]MBT4270430.1 Mur ligase [Candidatus Neomarinimicrobiota bacterium]